MTSTAVPPALARNVVDTWGAEGARWLTGLPALRARVAAAWELRLGSPYVLSYHWVAPATRADGTAAVLKLGLPGADHLPVEAATLECWGGAGAARLLAYEPAWGALLLERVEQLADGMGLPVERVTAWAFVKAVLSDVWTAEGGGEAASRAIDVARFLAPRL
ncbi:aminoglycoside phosphotransferase family protein [Phytohabitans kaempferiae]|uniref:Aminoglycoside phosphotransferase family protein n=1 Tax=Phytohabitans kaempferiae TaxID=1620943 RepID=A0ABV6M1N1_9ACTN